MPSKSLTLAADLRETIFYDAHILPLSIWGGSFDDYVEMEWSCHWHDEFEMMLIEKGSLYCTTYEGLGNPSTVTLSVGDIICINSAVLHSMKAIEKDTCAIGFVLPINFFDLHPLQNIEKKILQPIMESGLPYLLIHSNEPKASELSTAFKTLFSLRTPSPTYELYCIELICKIWRLLMEYTLEIQHSRPLAKQNLTEFRTKQMIAYIHEHFHEHITIQDLIKYAHLSRTECFHCFRETLKKTPMEYLNEYRLSTAAMLLTHSEKSIIEIALSCGFSDASYFSKIFHKTYGVSPKQYRKGERQKP